MADYIYLLQHRLTPMQRRALEAVRDAARAQGAPIFLAGGAVRDLTSGAPVRDLDFAVQGDVALLVEALANAGASLAGTEPRLLSRYMVFPGGVRAELSATMTISYPKPGEPQVQPAAILDDLRRRDFTANAMAISLNEGSYGLLLDPLNGVADLENRELRLVSNLGFIEQPALLIRAARLSERLGWTLEERTARRYENAKDEEAIERLSPEARGYELEEIFHEEDPLSAMAHLEAEGWLKHLSPVLSGLKLDGEVLDRVRDTLGQMEHLGLFTDPSPVYFPLLTAKLPAEQVASLKQSFLRSGFVRQIDSLEARTKELSGQLTSKAYAGASATWKLLFAVEPEVVLALASTSRVAALQAKFKAFFTEWPQARGKIPYGLMQEMRITPELPGYDRLLEDLFFALIDGKLVTPEETRAFLEPFSPPAPVQQAAPRRRAAKATRGRGRQAAAKAPVEEDEVDLDEDPDDTESKPARRASSPDDADAEDEEEDSDESDIDAPASGKSVTPEPVPDVEPDVTHAAPTSSRNKVSAPEKANRVSASEATKAKPASLSASVPSREKDPETEPHSVELATESPKQGTRSHPGASSGGAKGKAASAEEAARKPLAATKQSTPPKKAVVAKLPATSALQSAAGKTTATSVVVVPKKSPAKAGSPVAAKAAPGKAAAKKVAPTATPVTAKQASSPAKAGKKSAPAKRTGR